MRNHFLKAVSKEPTPAATNPPFNQVALLLHGDGTTGAQNNTFLDSSSNGFSPTRTGNTTQGSFTPFSLPDGNWSNYFDGNGDFLSVPANAAFNFGTGDWTFECWFNLTGNATANSGGNRDATLFSVGSTISNISFVALVTGNSTTTGTGLQIYKNLNTERSVVATVALGKSTWYHFAASKSSNTIRMFLNGTQVGTNFTDSTNWGSSTLLAQVSRLSSSTGWFNYFPGYISNLRVVKGTAVYTSNFTPLTASLTAITNTSLLTCQSNRFVDNSSNNFTLTSTGDVRVTAFSPFAPASAYSTSTNGGSAYFDGTGDYLTVGTNAAFTYGLSDFTMECWVYLTTTGTLRYIIDQRNSGTANAVIPSIYVSSSNVLTYFVSNAARITGTTALTTNTWHHVAVSRSSLSTKMFLNGVQEGSTYTDANNYAASRVVIASNSATIGNHLTGYTSNVRLVNGTAVYTTNFTPPTSPVTAITNTSLLLNFTNAGIFNNAAKNNLETVGNARLLTAQAKYGTASMFFDGSGDYLEIPYSPTLDLVGLPFTIEAWVYPTSSKTFGHRIFATGGGTVAWNSTTGIHVLFQIFNAAGTLDLQISNNTGTPIQVTTTGTVPINTWTHVAVCYDGANNVRLFINGIGQSFTIATPARPSTNPRANIGTIPGENAGNNPAMQGYIDDLRVTNGVAVYTGNFIPPTAAFPDL